ncbi:hypothetical protein C8Q80DRAFT_1108124 [Daedaleopsis nitida]|nr:hypothetical protein C8Q80DRAFT_1108124 [Daedaleopsis nitida]
MKLPYDVLLAVLDILDHDADLSGLSCMTQTCHFLRQAGIRHMLARPVTLRTPGDVLSFGLFMLEDERRRFTFLRQGLVIATNHLPPDAAGSLVELLSKVSHMETLALLDANQVLASDPRLPDAFASLTCLKRLRISAAQDGDNTDYIVYMLRRMKSPLASVTLDIPSALQRWSYGRLNCELNDPIGLLRNCASTLTELSGTNLEVRRHSVTYPQLRRLRIEFGLIPDISPYIMSFPNVTSLHVSCGAIFDSRTLPSFWMMNDDSQQRYGCWSGLEELGGNLEDIYILALRCPVTTLRVSARHPDCDLHLLTDILTRTRPANLRLELSSATLRPDATIDIASVFQESDAANYIRELELRISFSRNALMGDLHALLDRMVKAVEALPLASFRVHFDTESLAPAAGKLHTQHAVKASTELSMKRDFVQYIDHIRQACPSLKELVVDCAMTSDLVISFASDSRTDQ